MQLVVVQRCKGLQCSGSIPIQIAHNIDAHVQRHDPIPEQASPLCPPSPSQAQSQTTPKKQSVQNTKKHSPIHPLEHRDVHFFSPWLMNQHALCISPWSSAQTVAPTRVLPTPCSSPCVTGWCGARLRSTAPQGDSECGPLQTNRTL